MTRVGVFGVDQRQGDEVAGVRVKLTTNVVREKARARNVIGILRGSDPKLRDQYVVVGAHYDHLGMGGRYSLSPSERLIHYGADDNASGTAGVLELAQYFAAHPEKAARSIIFVGFTGEEIGLLGSAYFVKKPPVPLASITAMLNMDMIGRSKDGKVLVIGYKTSPQWAGILEGADRPYQSPNVGTAPDSAAAIINRSPPRASRCYSSSPAFTRTTTNPPTQPTNLTSPRK